MAEALRENFAADIAAGVPTIFHCSEYTDAVLHILNRAGAPGTITISANFGFYTAGGAPGATVLLANAVPIPALGDEVFIFTRTGLQGLHVDPGAGLTAALMWLYPIIAITCTQNYRIVGVFAP